jgi:hypothetical protein
MKPFRPRGVSRPGQVIHHAPGAVCCSDRAGRGDQHGRDRPALKRAPATGRPTGHRQELVLGFADYSGPATGASQRCWLNSARLRSCSGRSACRVSRRTNTAGSLPANCPKATWCCWMRSSRHHRRIPPTALTGAGSLDWGVPEPVLTDPTIAHSRIGPPDRRATSDLFFLGGSRGAQSGRRAPEPKGAETGQVRDPPSELLTHENLGSSLGRWAYSSAPGVLIPFPERGGGSCSLLIFGTLLWS